MYALVNISDLDRRSKIFYMQILIRSSTFSLQGLLNFAPRTCRLYKSVNTVGNSDYHTEMFPTRTTGRHRPHVRLEARSNAKLSVQSPHAGHKVLVYLQNQ
jgi:hypothetical protein